MPLINQPLTALTTYYRYIFSEISEDDSNYSLYKTIDEQISRIIEISNDLRSITNYRTQKYTEDFNILDIRGSTGKED